MPGIKNSQIENGGLIPNSVEKANIANLPTNTNQEIADLHTTLQGAVGRVTRTTKEGTLQNLVQKTFTFVGIDAEPVDGYAIQLNGVEQEPSQFSWTGGVVTLNEDITATSEVNLIIFTITSVVGYVPEVIGGLTAADI